MEERVARIEGILSQMDKRLNHVETEIAGLRDELRGEIEGLRAELRTKADKWEIRIWFLLILLLMTVYQFLR
ncbi:MAG TPA: hypothetical protein EYP17_09580 [Candidatus Latescibacteria bacterium]|nr:hypothetical protein [Candidatus Latescibacterota bacterium]